LVFEETMIDRWTARRAGQLAWLAAQGPRQPRFPFSTEAVIEREQRRRVAATIRYAYRHVPYYRETMDRVGLSPADIATAADLARLPVIERSELQRDPERFVSRAHPLEHYVALQTGGSSGAPVTVYHDPFTLIRAAAYHQRAGALHRRVAGKPLGCRTLAIAHSSHTARYRIDATLARLGRFVGARRRVVSILDPVERNVQEINRFRPTSSPRSALMLRRCSCTCTPAARRFTVRVWSSMAETRCRPVPGR
jgi:phenylacetate-coenzyme A ligase PaaK-like adenylate-forming protein